MGESTRYLGVDPGKTGAIVSLRPDGSVSLAVDMAQDDTELAALWNTVAQTHDDLEIVVEKVWSNPFWGRRHCFEFGRQKGRIEQAIASAGLSYYRITPTTWQKHFGLKKTASERKGSKGQREWKKRLHRKAIEIFDGRVTLSRADAYLMAEFCRLNVLEGTLC